MTQILIFITGCAVYMMLTEQYVLHNTAVQIRYKRVLRAPVRTSAGPRPATSLLALSPGQFFFNTREE